MFMMGFVLLSGLSGVGASAKYLDQAQCNAMYTAKKLFRKAGTAECSVVDMKTTIDALFSGNAIKESECNVQWTTMSNDMKPTGGSAKTILGFKDDINAKCGVQSGTNCWPTPPIQPPSTCACLGQTSIYNRLYLSEWTFCKNMKWLLCAAYGKLPRQAIAEKKITFVSAPKELTNGTYPFESTVTVHEICTLSKMCTNRAELFTLNKNDDFKCALPTASHLGVFLDYLRNDKVALIQSRSHSHAANILAPLN